VSEDDLLAVAEAAARAAGAVLVERFGGRQRPAATKSTPTDPVGEADLEATRAIGDVLADRRPHDAVLGEESGEAAGTTGLRWVVDPLDGTTNFLYGLPIWSVSIACEDESGGLAGVVFDPCRDEMFAAQRGRGACLNGRPIATSHNDDLSRALIGTGFAYAPAARLRQAQVLAELLAEVRDIRRGGSAAVDLAWVACGRLDGYYELGTRHWDRAAGMLLVQESGGVATPLGRNVGDGEGALAAGAALYPALSELVEDALHRGQTRTPPDQLH
jgi:myo-inositol-1(or 4)-monophosphatase